jgi:hypothetical protein
MVVTVWSPAGTLDLEDQMIERAVGPVAIPLC